MHKELLRITIKRPAWRAVSEAYKEINEIGSKENDAIKAELRYSFLGGKIQKTFNKEKNIC